MIELADQFIWSCLVALSFFIVCLFVYLEDLFLFCTSCVLRFFLCIIIISSFLLSCLYISSIFPVYVPPFGQVCVYFNVDFLVTVDHCGDIYLARYRLQCGVGVAGVQHWYASWPEQISGFCIN